MRLLTAVLGASIGALIATGTASATPLLDQSLVPGTLTPFTCSDGAVGGGTLICGQSFTVGISGTLTSAELYVSNASITGGSVVAGLYDSATFPTLLQTSSTPFSFSSAGFYSFLFNQVVVTGNSLVIAFFIDAAAVTFESSTTNSYSGGQVRVFTNTDVSHIWPTTDLYFKTYVEPAAAPVPEPASMTLLGLGLAGFGARRWRQLRTA